MLSGILAGLAAGALWGLIFVAPQALSSYSSSDIAFGRYAVYGLISAIVLLCRYKSTRAALTAKFIGSVLLLSCLSCSFYYYLVAAAVKSTGTSTTSLIIGLLPVTIPVFSGDKVARPALFYTSIVLICCGLLMLNLQLIADMLFGQTLSSTKVSGTFIAFFALMSWTAYGLLNTKLLTKHSEININTWSSMLGVGAFLTITPLWLIEDISSGDLAGHIRHFMDSQFIGWMIVIGAGSAWLAMLLWNYASRKLPAAISGQLIVSETIFALLYSYIYNHKLPTMPEALAALLLIIGVMAGFYSMKAKPELFCAWPRIGA